MDLGAAPPFMNVSTTGTKANIRVNESQKELFFFLKKNKNKIAIENKAFTGKL